MELCKLHRIEQGSDDFTTDCGKDLYFPDSDGDFNPNKEFNFCCYCGKPRNKAALKLMESAPTSTNTASPKLPSWEEVVRYSNLKPGSVIDDPMEFLHDIYGFIFRQLQA